MAVIRIDAAVRRQDRLYVETLQLALRIEESRQRIRWPAGKYANMRRDLGQQVMPTLGKRPESCRIWLKLIVGMDKPDGGTNAIGPEEENLQPRQ